MKVKSGICACVLALSGLLLFTDNIHAADGIAKADSLYKAGRYDAAISFLEQEVVPVFEAQCDTISLLKAWSILGCCHVEKGEHELAAKYCNLTVKALNYFGEDYYFVTNVVFNIGQMYHILGAYDEALPYLDRAITYELELGRPSIVCRRYIEKATTLMDMGEHVQALDILDNVLPHAVVLPNPHYRSQILYLKGLCYEELGDSLSARKAYTESEFSAHLKPFKSDYALVPGLTLKMGDYALADHDTTTAVEMYRYSVRNAKNVREYDTEIKALNALEGIFKESDPEMSALYAARADSLTFAPFVSELALKMALVGIEFPRREREQQVQIQRLRISLLVLLAAILAFCALFLWFRFRVLRRVAEAEHDKAEAEHDKAEMLERELDQKQRLLALAESASDRALSQKVRQIASELGDNGELTRREREICAMISQGLLNKEIADKLHISLRTVQTHRNTIYRKLNVTNTAELIKALDEVSENCQNQTD